MTNENDQKDPKKSQKIDSQFPTKQKKASWIYSLRFLRRHQSGLEATRG